jgi:type VI secretion system secreted protein VgrG
VPVILSDKRSLVSTNGPFSADQLIPERLAGAEGLCTLFSYDVDLITDQVDMTPADMLGKTMGIVLGPGTAEPAVIHGHIVRLQIGDHLGGQFGATYRRISCRLVPWFWFLDHTTDCRVFQNQTVQEILEVLFQDAGFTDFAFVLQGTLAPREYVIQYNETDYAFACRLMAEEGLVWWVAMAEDAHTLTITDHNDGLKTSGAAALGLVPRGAAKVRNSYDEWRAIHSWKPGKVATSDSEFRAISTDLGNEEASVLGLDLADSFEMFVWPGRYPTTARGDSPAARDDGAPVAKRMIEALESEATRFGFVTESFSPMLGVQIAKFATPDTAGQSETFTVERISRTMSDETHLNARSTPMCQTAVTVFAPDTPYRSRPQAPRPAVPNLMVGTIVGPDGEEIEVDEFGRVKVQFHWDRLGEGNENASCWMRLSQAWAGNGFGIMHYPRIGTEVIVGFLDDDIDHPVVMGTLHNNETAVPITLPDEKTKTGIITRSSPGGGASDFNALWFDDKAGEEKVYLQAQKDYERLVKNNETVTVKVDRTMLIEGKQKYTVKGDYDLKVAEGNYKVEISKGNFDTKVAEGNRGVEISKGNYDTKVSMGNLTVKVSQGKIGTEAMQAIELKVGSNSIKIDQMGITIKGAMIKIEGSTMFDAKAPMAKVSGDGMLTLKGGIIMIN